MISFVIPAYNASKTIKKCIDSIIPLKQVADIEVVVVNDGSSDDTLEKLNTIAEQYDFIKVVDQINQGVSVARNSGIKNAKNEFIYFVDADDCISAPFFAKWLNLVKNEKIDLYAFNYITVSAKGETVNRLPATMMLDAHTLTSCFLSMPLLGQLRDSKDYIGAKVYQYIIRREVLINNNICFPRGIQFSEDLCFFLSLIKHVNQIKYIDDVGYYYYVFENSLSHSTNENFYNDIMKVYRYIADMNLEFIDTARLKLGFINVSLQYYANHFNYQTYKKATRQILYEVENVNYDLYGSELNLITWFYYSSLKHRSTMGTFVYNKYLSRIIRVIKKK